jgi:hypothetical protein
MTNTQLFLAVISVVSAEIGVVLLFMFRGFGALESRLVVLEADLRRFYHELGEHSADIATIKERGK